MGKGEDGEATYAHFCLQNIAMTREERAFVIASIQIRRDAEEEQEKELKRKASAARR